MKTKNLLVYLAVLMALLGAALWPPQNSAAQAPEGSEYVVQADDWLSKIAEKELGDALAYPAIVEATNAKAAEDASFTAITDPNVIDVGQKLWLPAPAGSAAMAPAPAPAAPDGNLTPEQLQNATYSGIYTQPVTLSAGKYEGEPFVEGGAARPVVTFINNTESYGDLNGDGASDAVALLVENSGGSGVFSYVGAQLNQGGQPADADAVLLGDRTQVISMAIANGQVVVEIVTPGPDDPLCCGTQKLRKTLALSGNMLAEVGSEELGTVSLDDLMGTSWVLERLEFDQPVAPETTITASFADGQVSGSAGCNNYNGSVTSDSGQNLTVGPLVTTRMACPEPAMSQELQYLTALQAASQWSYFPGQLAVTYIKDDGSLGTLFFDPAAPAAEQAEAAPAGTSSSMIAGPTEVINFAPTAVPAETREGSCFANAIGLGRTDAYRCTVGNEIFDPCFVVDDAPTVVCGANPTSGDIGFSLALTEPLPAPDPGNLAMPWLLELADGQVCGLMTGTIPGVGERTAPYGCPDQSYLFEDIQQGEIWMAEKAVIGVKEDGYFAEQSDMVAIARVWQ